MAAAGESIPKCVFFFFSAAINFKGFDKKIIKNHTIPDLDLKTTPSSQSFQEQF